MTVCLVFGAMPGYSALQWHWEAIFSQSERHMLRKWLQQSHAALERYAGPLPFDVHVYLHRKESASEPVPWANTWRGTEQALYFYVNPGFAYDAFMRDWTAAHEFAHLLLPYLGRENAWFSEGFASYLQYALMHEMGVVTKSDVNPRRDKKMRLAAKALTNTPLSLPDNTLILRKRGAYPTFYWGGALYFKRVDVALQGEGQSLRGVLRLYLGGSDHTCSLQRYYSSAYEHDENGPSRREISGPRCNLAANARHKKRGRKSPRRDAVKARQATSLISRAAMRLPSAAFVWNSTIWSKFI